MVREADHRRRPEDRVAEFYAVYARFLHGRGRHGHGRGGPQHRHGSHGCHAEHRSERGPIEV